jgi:hypothetical protein
MSTLTIFAVAWRSTRRPLGRLFAVWDKRSCRDCKENPLINIVAASATPAPPDRARSPPAPPRARSAPRLSRPAYRLSDALIAYGRTPPRPRLSERGEIGRRACFGFPSITAKMRAIAFAIAVPHICEIILAIRRFSPSHSGRAKLPSAYNARTSCRIDRPEWAHKSFSCLCNCFLYTCKSTGLGSFRQRTCIRACPSSICTCNRNPACGNGHLGASTYSELHPRTNW